MKRFFRNFLCTFLAISVVLGSVPIVDLSFHQKAYAVDVFDFKWSAFEDLLNYFGFNKEAIAGWKKMYEDGSKLGNEFDQSVCKMQYDSLHELRESGVSEAKTLHDSKVINDEEYKIMGQDYKVDKRILEDTEGKLYDKMVNDPTVSAEQKAILKKMGREKFKNQVRLADEDFTKCNYMAPSAICNFFKQTGYMALGFGVMYLIDFLGNYGETSIKDVLMAGYTNSYKISALSSEVRDLLSLVTIQSEADSLNKINDSMAIAKSRLILLKTRVNTIINNKTLTADEKKKQLQALAEYEKTNIDDLCEALYVVADKMIKCDSATGKNITQVYSDVMDSCVCFKLESLPLKKSFNESISSFWESVSDILGPILANVDSFSIYKTKLETRCTSISKIVKEADLDMADCQRTGVSGHANTVYKSAVDNNWYEFVKPGDVGYATYNKDTKKYEFSNARGWEKPITAGDKKYGASVFSLVTLNYFWEGEPPLKVLIADGTTFDQSYCTKDEISNLFKRSSATTISEELGLAGIAGNPKYLVCEEHATSTQEVEAGKLKYRYTCDYLHTDVSKDSAGCLGSNVLCYDDGVKENKIGEDISEMFAMKKCTDL